MDRVLTWMESSAPAHFVVDNSWVFPTLETLHFIGLILLFGSMCMIDLRFMGFARHIPREAVLRFIPVALLGFLINLTTGILFLFSDPFRYYPNLSFRLKMLAVLLAGLNAIWFKFVLGPGTPSLGNSDNPGPLLKAIAALSLLLWTSVIVLGRMIPYLE